MDEQLILQGKATLEDMYELYDRKGIICIAEDGKITRIERGE